MRKKGNTVRAVSLSTYLSLLLVLAVFVTSCANPSDIDSGDASTGNFDNTVDTREESNDVNAVYDETLIALAKDGASDYVVVQSSSATKGSKGAVWDFLTDFKKKTGVDLSSSLYNDKSAPVEKEIIIGSVWGREESVEALDGVSYTGYDIRAVGEKIIVSAYSDTMLEKALDVLLYELEQDGNVWYVPRTISFTAESSKAPVPAPKYETDGNIEGIYDCGSDNYQVSIGGTDESEYEAYLERLVEKSFSLYDDNEMNGNRFATYVSEKVDGEATAVYTMFFADEGRCNVVYGPLGYLPEAKAISAPAAEDAVATPTITQLGRLGMYQLNSGAPGLCYVIQLADGRFIILDGGPRDTVVQPMKEENGEWVEDGEARESNDTEALYELLVSMLPEGETKPRIAAWIITHAHSDHICLPTDFLKTYKDGIILELAVFNFPNYNTTELKDGTSKSLQGLVNELVAVIENYYRSTEIYVPHTGQQLNFPGCELEFLYTHEEYLRIGSNSANDNSLVFRVTLGDTTFMVLGDSDRQSSYVGQTYKEYLKSDIMQVTHHGANGGDLELYKYIAPDICFWPVSDYACATNPQQLGTAEGYEFNAWLWENVDTHYIETETHVITCG